MPIILFMCSPVERAELSTYIESELTRYLIFLSTHYHIISNLVLICTAPSSSPSLFPSSIPTLVPTDYVYTKWLQLSASGLTPTRMYHTSVYSASSGLIYVIGGKDTNTFYADVWTYNFKTLVWSTVTTTGTFTARHSSSSVLDPTSQIIYVFGGTRTGPTASSRLWSFTITTGTY